ncbi:MAG: hypothetical protein ABIP50_03465 [Candidatus Saccharimonadales bacterium]
MMKKVLISVGVILIVAGIAIGVLYFTKHSTQVPANNTPVVVPVPDLSKDYGACRILDETSIKTALGTIATTLQAPQNMGIAQDKLAGAGVSDIVSDSQVCIYAFNTGGTVKNGYNSDNAFIIQETAYSNESGPKSLIEQQKLDPTSVIIEQLGDVAFYNASTAAKGPGAINSFGLQVFTGKTSVEYTIHQSAETASFTSETGKAALTQLAKLAKQV